MFFSIFWNYVIQARMSISCKKHSEGSQFLVKIKCYNTEVQLYNIERIREFMCELTEFNKTRTYLWNGISLARELASNRVNFLESWPATLIITFVVNPESQKNNTIWKVLPKRFHLNGHTEILSTDTATSPWLAATDWNKQKWGSCICVSDCDL